MKCYACNQPLPRVELKPGDIVEHDATGRLGIILESLYQHGVYMPVIVLTAGSSSAGHGGTRVGSFNLWRRTNIHVVHGHIHISERL